MEQLPKNGHPSRVDVALDRCFDHPYQSGKGALGVDSGLEPEAFQPPRAIETTFQFRQTVNGLPAITPGAGQVRLTVDNDGTITRLHNSTRQVDRLSERPKSTTATPGAEAPLAQPRGNAENIERLLAVDGASVCSAWQLKGVIPIKASVVSGSTEVGYDPPQGEREIGCTEGAGGRLRRRVAQTLPGGGADPRVAAALSEPTNLSAQVEGDGSLVAS